MKAYLIIIIFTILFNSCGQRQQKEPQKNKIMLKNLSLKEQLTDGKITPKEYGMAISAELDDSLFDNFDDGSNNSRLEVVADILKDIKEINKFRFDNNIRFLEGFLNKNFSLDYSMSKSSLIKRFIFQLSRQDQIGYKDIYVVLSFLNLLKEETELQSDDVFNTRSFIDSILIMISKENLDNPDLILKYAKLEKLLDSDVAFVMVSFNLIRAASKKTKLTTIEQKFITRFSKSINLKNSKEIFLELSNLEIKNIIKLFSNNSSWQLRQINNTTRVDFNVDNIPYNISRLSTVIDVIINNNPSFPYNDNDNDNDNDENTDERPLLKGVDLKMKLIKYIHFDIPLIQNVTKLNAISNAFSLKNDDDISNLSPSVLLALFPIMKNDIFMYFNTNIENGKLSFDNLSKSKGEILTESGDKKFESYYWSKLFLLSSNRFIKNKKVLAFSDQALLNILNFPEIDWGFYFDKKDIKESYLLNKTYASDISDQKDLIAFPGALIIADDRVVLKSLINGVVINQLVETKENNSTDETILDIKEGVIPVQRYKKIQTEAYKCTSYGLYKTCGETEDRYRHSFSIIDGIIPEQALPGNDGRNAQDVEINILNWKKSQSSLIINWGENGGDGKKGLDSPLCLETFYRAWQGYSGTVNTAGKSSANKKSAIKSGSLSLQKIHVSAGQSGNGGNGGSSGDIYVGENFKSSFLSSIVLIPGLGGHSGQTPNCISSLNKEKYLKGLNGTNGDIGIFYLKNDNIQ